MRRDKARTGDGRAGNNAIRIQRKREAYMDMDVKRRRRRRRFDQKDQHKKRKKRGGLEEIR